MFLSRAARRIATASGCSLPASTAAANRSRSASVRSALREARLASSGLPAVTVPVLSKQKVSTRARRSSAAPLLTRMPVPASRPRAAMIAAGVARSSEQGQATTSTASDGYAASRKRSVHE